MCPYKIEPNPTIRTVNSTSKGFRCRYWMWANKCLFTGWIEIVPLASDIVTYIILFTYIILMQHTRMCMDTFQQRPQQWFRNCDHWVRLGPNLKNSFWYDRSNGIVFWTVNSKFEKSKNSHNRDTHFPLLRDLRDAFLSWASLITPIHGVSTTDAIILVTNHW